MAKGRKRKTGSKKAYKKTSNKVVGVVRDTINGYTLEFFGKRKKQPIPLSKKEMNGACDGDVVTATVSRASRNVSFSKARITKIIGREDDPKIISLMSAYEMNLSTQFSQAALAQTNNMQVPELGNREDLRNTPLVTIDGPDARDFDDAVFATKRSDGGFNIIVAIADVAHYIPSDSALDKEAFERGNSTYFPDMVIPMLPAQISNDLCSLKPQEDRACVAVHMHIDKDGTLKDFKFKRALMNSKARLTYEQVQAARDGTTDSVTAPLKTTVIDPLYEAYEILAKARSKRGTLDFNMPEQKIIINKQNRVTDIKKFNSLESNKVIEELMILANIAAATELENREDPCVYRVHDKPSSDKLEALQLFIENFTSMSWPKGKEITADNLQEILKKSSGITEEEQVKMLSLRAQSKAVYSPDNNGHFGLSLDRYAHFTSPIRRYADLLVHRSILGELSHYESINLDIKSEKISKSERDSVSAERKATDRFIATYLSEHIDSEFDGRISSVTYFGMFVRLDDTGADVLIPISDLPGGYYDYEEDQHALVERGNNGQTFRMSDPVRVKIKQTDILAGRVRAEITNNKTNVPASPSPAP